MKQKLVSFFIHQLSSPQNSVSPVPSTCLPPRWPPFTSPYIRINIPWCICVDEEGATKKQSLDIKYTQELKMSDVGLPIFLHKARFSRGRRPRPCWISVKTIYWSGDFQERFFLFDPNLTSGMSAALMQGHCLRRRPCIKQHMSGGLEFHRKYHRQLPPHLTRHETLHAAGLG